MLAKTECNKAPIESLHTFGEKLIFQMITRRKQFGLTQLEVEERLGVADHLVGNWEAGMRKPSGFLLFCWAETLGCDLVLKEKTDGKIQS